MKKVDITTEMFKAWTHDPVTKMLMTELTELRDDIEEGLKNEDIILEDNAQLKLVRLVGRREGLNAILHFEFTEEENESEETDSSQSNS